LRKNNLQKAIESRSAVLNAVQRELLGSGNPAFQPIIFSFIVPPKLPSIPEALFCVNITGFRQFIGRNPMGDKVISIESADGPHQLILRRIWRMVPDRDKDDLELKRLLAFRLRVDGEAVTSEYLMRKIRDMIQCAYKGRLFDFLKSDSATGGCRSPARITDPPEIA
jgi:hypothetical protein